MTLKFGSTCLLSKVEIDLLQNLGVYPTQGTAGVAVEASAWDRVRLTNKFMKTFNWLARVLAWLNEILHNFSRPLSQSWDTLTGKLDILAQYRFYWYSVAEYLWDPLIALRTFAQKSSNIDFFSSETLTSLRLLINNVKNVKRMGGHRLRCGDKMPKRSPKIWGIGLPYWI